MVARVTGIMEGQIQRESQHVSVGSTVSRAPSIAKAVLVEEPRIGESIPSYTLDPSQLKGMTSKAQEALFRVEPHKLVYPISSEHSVRVAKYNTHSLIGYGTQSQVFEGIECATQKKVALKCNRWQKFDKEFQYHYHELLKEEILLKQLAKCPYVPTLLDAFDVNSSERVLVMEKLGKNVFDAHCASQSSCHKSLTMAHILSITMQVLLALDHFEKEKIVHCDLKPENLIFNLENMHLKVIDFGHAYHKLSLPEDLYVQTISYRSPEMTLCRGGSQSVDMWSLGFIIAELVAGESIINTRKEIVENSGLSCEEQEDLHMTNIVNIRGMPPHEWLMHSTDKVPEKSSKKRRPLFKKMEDGQYYLIQKAAEPCRPADRFVRTITEIFKKQRPDHPKEELHQLVDLIGKMTTYKDRITPKDALQHPLFAKYLFWEVAVAKPSSIHAFDIFVRDSLEPYFGVNLDKYTRSHWLLPKEKDECSYKVVFYGKDNAKLREDRCVFSHRAKLDVDSDHIYEKSLFSGESTTTSSSSSSSSSPPPVDPAASSSSSSSSSLPLLLLPPAKKAAEAAATSVSFSSSPSTFATATALPRAISSRPTRKRASAALQTQTHRSGGRKGQLISRASPLKKTRRNPA